VFSVFHPNGRFLPLAASSNTKAQSVIAGIDAPLQYLAGAKVRCAAEAT